MYYGHVSRLTKVIIELASLNVTLLVCIIEVLDSNHGQDASYSEGFCGFLVHPPKPGYDPRLQNLFHLLVVLLSDVYNLDSDSIGK